MFFNANGKETRSFPIITEDPEALQYFEEGCSM